MDLELPRPVPHIPPEPSALKALSICLVSSAVSCCSSFSDSSSAVKIARRLKTCAKFDVIFSWKEGTAVMAIINAITPNVSVMRPPVIHDLSGISELRAHMKITPAMIMKHDR